MSETNRSAVEETCGGERSIISAGVKHGAEGRVHVTERLVEGTRVLAGSDGMPGAEGLPKATDLVRSSNLVGEDNFDSANSFICARNSANAVAPEGHLCQLTGKRC